MIDVDFYKESGYNVQLCLCKNNIKVKHFNNLVLSDIEKIDSKEINDLKEYCDQNSINYLDSDIIKIIIRNNKSLEMLPNK